MGNEEHRARAVEKVKSAVRRVQPVDVLQGGEIAQVRRGVLRLRPVPVATPTVHRGHAAVRLGQTAETNERNLHRVVGVWSSALRVFGTLAVGNPWSRFDGRFQHAVLRTRGIRYLLVISLRLVLAWRVSSVNGETSHDARGGAIPVSKRGGASFQEGGACGQERGSATVLRGGACTG